MSQALSHSKRCRHNCTKKPFCIIHSENFTLFTILFYVFTLFLFKIYNYNCTIPILQLQTTFYNCTNCHQLHIKISPACIRALQNLTSCYFSTAPFNPNLKHRSSTNPIVIHPLSAASCNLVRSLGGRESGRRNFRFQPKKR